MSYTKKSFKMKEVTGKFNTAKVFTENLDEKSQKQIENLCNQEFVKDSKIRPCPQGREALQAVPVRVSCLG